MWRLSGLTTAILTETKSEKQQNHLNESKYDYKKNLLKPIIGEPIQIESSQILLFL